MHNRVPTGVLSADGRPCLAIGGAGGTKIVTGVAQILVNVLDRGLSVQQAVEVPRVHNEGWESELDSRIAPETRERLRALGHHFDVITPRYARPGFSRINGIGVGDDGVLASGVDPFTDAGAAAID